MEFIYDGPGRERENIKGVRFKPNPNGSVCILEPPLWETSEEKTYKYKKPYPVWLTPLQ